jgi:hypothetical protein
MFGERFAVSLKPTARHLEAGDQRLLSIIRSFDACILHLVV